MKIDKINSSVGFPSLVGVNPLNKNWGSSHRAAMDDSGIKTEFITNAHEPGVIYTRRTQPSADRILQNNQRMRIEEPTRDLSFGRWVGNIPNNDLIMLQTKYPDLKSKDKQTREKAWAKLMKSTDFEPYAVVPRNKV